MCRNYDYFIINCFSNVKPGGGHALLSYIPFNPVGFIHIYPINTALLVLSLKYIHVLYLQFGKVVFDTPTCAAGTGQRCIVDTGLMTPLAAATCHADASCIETQVTGLYRCKCDPNYTGNGITNCQCKYGVQDPGIMIVLKLRLSMTNPDCFILLEVL